jgi:hypothetical protein
MYDLLMARTKVQLAYGTNDFYDVTSITRFDVKRHFDITTRASNYKQNNWVTLDRVSPLNVPHSLRFDECTLS